MKKGIWLSLGALLLIGVIVFAIWYINEEGKMHTGSKDAFIPYNSAMVVSVNAQPRLSSKVEKTFGRDMEEFRKRFLVRVTDTLQRQGYVMSYPYVVAMRVEGKSDIRFLYVMDNKEVLSRGEIANFLNQAFAAGTEKVRRYDRHKIYTLKEKRETVYFAVCGGIVLISDSDLYIEDGLKQFDLEENEGEPKSRYQNLNKYFSAGAGMNIFLNTAVFTEVLPLMVEFQKIWPHLDVAHLFKWGAWDGEFGEDGICLNGFLHYAGLEKSYVRTLEKQQPRESIIDEMVPSHLISLGMLNLSQPTVYFAALDVYRHATGRKEAVYHRKQQFNKMFGKEREEELRQLLQGEFAIVDLAYNEATQQKDGLIIVALKSGGLGKTIVENMLGNYARFDGKTLGDYERRYSIDREKSFTYYQFPVDDLATMYWGALFEGIKSRFVLIEDNYLILASSEKAVKSFLKDYVHRSFIRDVEWYRNLKTKLAGKYNLSYFARTEENLPLYKNLTKGKAEEFIAGHMEELKAFPTLALQWSNEGGMLYNTLFFNTAPILEDVQPHVLWQTKLEARVSMKPVPVINHVTGERELFVQDDNNTIYLVNDAGRILWKMPVEGRINSDVYQVDLFKNGKLQYLFSTPSKMYLIDRNGNAAGRFPMAFRAQCEQGITVFDYENNKDYRIFVPCVDRRVYLYGLDGNLVKGWNPEKTDKPIVTKVQHFRVDGKDYLVFADRYRLYILDRKGKERVRISSVFDLPNQTDIYLANQKGQTCLVFAGQGGTVHCVGFSGQMDHFQVKGIGENFRMNVADINSDGVLDCVFTDGNRLLVTQMNGNMLLEEKIEAENLDYPYVYRFSSSDTRIGLTDPKRGQMLLLDQSGQSSKGFPLSGDSPFSIVFSGNDGFFLFAGADNGSLIKYKVQR